MAILLLLIFFLLSHIELIWQQEKECPHQSNIEIPHLKIDTIAEFIKNSGLKYIAEREGEDYWKAPYETERDGGGDCEDLAIWLVYKLEKIGYDAWLTIGKDAMGQFHAWVRVRIIGAGRMDIWNLDMQWCLIYEEIQDEPLNMNDYMKLDEVRERQINYEKGQK